MKYIYKVMITIILTLTVLILVKSNTNFKEVLYKNVYDKSFNFSKINKLYNMYVVNNKIFSKYIKTDTVFNEKLTYNKKENYNGGVKLSVSKNYIVPANESGIVVYIGNKEKFNNTVIIQRTDGIDEWYGNIKNTNLKLYDYVNKKEVIGEVDDYLYLLYKKDGNIINYEEVLK